MAPRQWIRELSEKDKVDDVYLVWQKNLLVARNGRPYLNIILGDKSGKLECRVWNMAEKLDSLFSPRDLIRATGQVIRYQDRLQLNAKDIKKADASGVDLSIFIPSSERSMEKMQSELDSIIESLEDPHLKDITKHFLKRSSLSKRFHEASAAKSIHHAWSGGLMEHTLSVCGLMEVIWRHFETLFPGFLNRDLMITGALLHDVGKTWELEKMTFDYTDEGRLLGHLVMMCEAVAEYIRTKPDFPKHLSLHLKHIILSHHGELEHGSPKRPQTAEAWAVHYGDILDARMSWLHQELEDVEEGEWTRYQRQYDRFFWKPPKKNPGVQDSGTEEDGLEQMQAEKQNRDESQKGDEPQEQRETVENEKDENEKDEKQQGLFRE